jgi:hypothetical protein
LKPEISNEAKCTALAALHIANDHSWNRRTQPDNPPLTIEQLRQLDGEPVWVMHKDGSGARWGIVNSYPTGLCADVEAGTAYWFKDYCETIAYAHRKDGEKNV